MMRRISIRIQGAARGAYCIIFTFCRNTEYGLKGKQDAYIIFCDFPKDSTHFQVAVGCPVHPQQ